MAMKFTSPFIEQTSSNAPKIALIILNLPIPKPPSVCFQKLWNLSLVRICADGGANRLYSATYPSTDYIPDKIVGDLDSLLPEVQAHFEKHKTEVTHDKCQDTNDLDKALKRCEGYDKVFIYGAYGGRFDQEMASFYTLYKWATTFKNQIYLYSEENCSFLIAPNVKTEIKMPFYDETVPSNRFGEGPTCGLIPLGMSCESITTTGLKWNLNGDTPLSFSTFISSSNRMMEPTITVEASQPIVFTAEITKLERKDY
ncbi:unnamed protein product [Cylindrotheca closterium]|uniref:Thiamin pyrophosphokinase thiamin-binding domain-containing protein n=1 Tax=Cylindrotheca closterium TaxID=2856 RepID=A0AAD2FL71_9STRA|nr:unnamed protein product [Cylindrotheca closterium]